MHGHFLSSINDEDEDKDPNQRKQVRELSQAEKQKLYLEDCQAKKAIFVDLVLNELSSDCKQESLERQIRVGKQDF